MGLTKDEEITLRKQGLKADIRNNLGVAKNIIPLFQAWKNDTDLTRKAEIFQLLEREMNQLGKSIEHIDASLDFYDVIEENFVNPEDHAKETYFLNFKFLKNELEKKLRNSEQRTVLYRNYLTDIYEKKQYSVKVVKDVLIGFAKAGWNVYCSSDGFGIHKKIIICKEKLDDNKNPDWAKQKPSDSVDRFYLVDPNKELHDSMVRS